MSVTDMIMSFEEYRSVPKGTYCRKDSVLILLDEDPVPWTSVRGGDVVQAGRWGKKYSDLVLSRIRSDTTVLSLPIHISRVGGRSKVLLAHFTSDGKKSGHGLVYEGVLARVDPADFDANANDVAEDRITIIPKSIRAY